MNLLKACRLAALLCAGLLSHAVWAQTSGLEMPADAKISAALNDISTERIQASITKLASFGTRASFSAQDAASIAAGRGIGAARQWIKSEFERYSKDCGSCLEVKEDAFSTWTLMHPWGRAHLANVYAVLKGTDPQAHVVLVTGHYDSRNSDPVEGTKDAPGANDDASGTAVSLECARVLSKLKFPQTIIFLAVPGEELGLRGSEHFAQMAKGQGWQIDAALNNDIVGGDKSAGQDPHVVRVFSEGFPNDSDWLGEQLLRLYGGENDSRSRELARYVYETAGVYEAGFNPLLIFRLDRYLRSGDHVAFNEQGFGAVRFAEYRENFDHQHQDVRTEHGIDYGDKLEYVDFDYVAHVARLNAATLASLASAPAAPSNVLLAADTLENASTLSWQPSHGASDYQVVWRATSSPVWEHAQKIGAITRTTLDVSKDNVVFGVRALDAAGHVSLPTIPTVQVPSVVTALGTVMTNLPYITLVLALLLIVALILLRRTRAALKRARSSA